MWSALTWRCWATCQAVRPVTVVRGRLWVVVWLVHTRCTVLHCPYDNGCRYRTEMCQFGASCTRPVCFFAHGEHQLRHTGMPGGPQPVVAPPEPNPALAAAGFPGAVTDPAVKQQQQLLALQAAAAGFSSHQMRSDSVLPVLDPLGQAGHGAAGGAGAGGYGGLMDGGGSMDMSALHRELSQVSTNFNTALPASAPLSAPLPQLPPDLLAALQNMGNGPTGQGPLSPLGGGLMHQGSGIPSSYSSGLPPPRPLARSLTVDAGHPALQGNEHTPAFDELAKQLAMMQLMQANGASNASAPLPQIGNRAMSDLLGQLAHMQGQADQQAAAQHAAAAAAAAQVSCTAGLDLETFLATPNSGAMQLQADGSFSCPLPPMYGSNPSLTHLLSQAAATAPAASANANPATRAQCICCKQFGTAAAAAAGRAVHQHPGVPHPIRQWQGRAEPRPRQPRHVSSGRQRARQQGGCPQQEGAALERPCVPLHLKQGRQRPARCCTRHQTEQHQLCDWRQQGRRWQQHRQQPKQHQQQRRPFGHHPVRPRCKPGGCWRP